MFEPPSEVFGIEISDILLEFQKGMSTEELNRGVSKRLHDFLDNEDIPLYDKWHILHFKYKLHDLEMAYFSGDRLKALMEIMRAKYSSKPKKMDYLKKHFKL